MMLKSCGPKETWSQAQQNQVRTTQCNLPHNRFEAEQTKTFPEIETANAIYQNFLGPFRNYGLDYIFFRNETFLFFKIES